MRSQKRQSSQARYLAVVLIVVFSANDTASPGAPPWSSPSTTAVRIPGPTAPGRAKKSGTATAAAAAPPPRSCASPGRSPWSAEHDAVAAEVGDNVEPAAERLDVAGQGADLGRAGFGALDGGHPLLAHAHPAGDLRLGQAEPGALLGQRPGAVRGDEGGRAAHYLVRLAGEELLEERPGAGEGVRHRLGGLPGPDPLQDLGRQPDRFRVVI